MAELKVLTLPKLTIYDEKLKAKMASDDTATLNSAKEYADSLADNYDPAGTAQTKVDELASGQVNTNKTNIEDLQAGKADKATTLAGYGIEDAYTKSEVDSAVASAVANADHLKREIVSQLPEVEEADEHTIYMVGDGDGSLDSVYEEYMLINNGFEKIGSSEVDLTNYVLTTDIATGSSNGSISVKGTDVAVKGLGSAAFADTTAFDSAGTAESKVNALAEGAVATNTSDIADLKSRVQTLENTTLSEITDEEIEALFTT